MYKLFKKFGSLALVICTVVALAALPVSAEEYWVTYIPDPELADAYGNTFTPGLSIKGEDSVFEHAKMSGVVWTHSRELCTDPVYSLAKCTLGYNDAAHNTKTVVCCEYLGIVEDNTRYILYRHPDMVVQGEEEINIKNDEENPKEWLSLSGHAMISKYVFTVTNSNLYRFPSRLGSFEWSKMITLDDIVES